LQAAENYLLQFVEPPKEDEDVEGKLIFPNIDSGKKYVAKLEEAVDCKIEDPPLFEVVQP
jgi:hypothetical protein